MPTDATPAAAAPDRSVDAFPECAEDEPWELHDLHVRGAGHAAAVGLDRAEVVNCRLDGCSVAGVVSRRGRISRVHVEDCRLRGVTWADGIVRDLTVDTVTAEDLSFRFSTLQRVVFRDCRLPGLDLTEATLDGVRFERCDLRGAVFAAARVKGLRLEGCDLSGCTGAEALTGASVHPDDLLTLAPSLAAAFGITLE